MPAEATVLNRSPVTKLDGRALKQESADPSGDHCLSGAEDLALKESLDNPLLRKAASGGQR